MNAKFSTRSLLFFILLSLIFSCIKSERTADTGEDSKLSSDKIIRLFQLKDSENQGKNLGKEVTVTIDTINFTISLSVPYNAILTGLRFNIETPDNAKITPSSGEEVNFELIADSNPKVYRKIFKVTAQDGSSKDYTVNITKALSGECSIKSFKLINHINTGKKLVKDITGTINPDDFTISLIVPNTAVIEGLKPTIETDFGATVSPANEISQDFISGEAVAYTVTAPNGTKNIYKVTIIKEIAPKLTSFIIQANVDKGVPNQVESVLTHDDDSDTGSISLKFPKGANDINLTGLTSAIQVPDGCVVDPASGEISGEIEGKAFTLLKGDTGSTRVYTVTAVKSPYISRFVFASSGNAGIDSDVVGNIDHSNNTINLVVPSGIDLTSVRLTPTIQVGDAKTITSSPQNFSNPVSYEVVSSTDENFTKTYSVEVRKVSSEAKITKFELEKGYPGSIIDNVAGSDRGRIVVHCVALASRRNTKLPSIEVSRCATVSSTHENGFSRYNIIYEYTVTAEDKKTTKTYDMFMYNQAYAVTKDEVKLEGNDITTASVSVDNDKRVITFSVSSTTNDLTALMLSLNSTRGYFIETSAVQDFSNGKEVRYEFKKYTFGGKRYVSIGYYWVRVTRSL
ncbi:DUF5018 domain-containing protein [Ichthyobacterium seriolicida]|uniref:Pkd domain containing protein n=1 Tax=Ichthyobacterium seriolicida TaxID=242600 RepID=A0A1J1DWM4_9FLAO|nr:DUF5018 domain-containing protein [Ichthyobacterium seriolicida]BAV94258.1 hypothetical protein JBKA6_0245 [Ichthyobacterium seriolicida]